MMLPPNARAKGLTRMGSPRHKPRGLISLTEHRDDGVRSHRTDFVGDEGSDSWIVGNREGPLESFRLVREIVSAGHGDELLRALGGRGALPGHLEEIFFFQAEDGIRDVAVTGVQTCALPI